MPVNGPRQTLYNGTAEEHETKLQERVAVGRAVEIRIKVGVDYLIDKVSQAHCDRLKQQRTCYLCGKTFKHWYTLRQHKETHLHTRQSKSEWEEGIEKHVSRGYVYAQVRSTGLS